MTSKILDQIIVLITYCLFVLIYSYIVVVDYRFGGFNFERSEFDYVVILLLVIFTYYLPINKKNIIYLYHVISIYFILLPAAVLTLYGGENIIHFFIIFFGTSMVPIFYHLFKIHQSNTHIRSREINLYFFIIFMYGVLLWSAYVSGFNFNLDFSKVYEYRFDFNESITFPLNYILPFAGGPLASFLAVYYFGQKKKVNLLLILSASVFLYGFTSHKSFMFGPIFSIIIYIFLLSKHDLSKLLGILLIALSLVTLLSDGELAIISGSMFGNRVVFLPVGIAYQYMKEFNDVGYMYWAESKVGFGLFESPLVIDSANYIAKIMTGSDRISANVGWLASGYMNLGIFGVFIYSAIIGFAISRFDVLSKYFGVGILTASFSQPLFSLITSIDLFTWLLTGGILMFILVLQVIIFNNMVKTEISPARIA